MQVKHKLLIALLLLTGFCKAQDTLRVPSNLKDMVYIPPVNSWTFQYHDKFLGSERKLDIEVNAFFIDKYEVSIGDYLELSSKDAKTSYINSIKELPHHPLKMNYSDIFKTGDEAGLFNILKPFPITFIEYDSAKNYAEKLHKRLPTELELAYLYDKAEVKLSETVNYSELMPCKSELGMQTINKNSIYYLYGNIKEMTEDDFVINYPYSISLPHIFTGIANKLANWKMKSVHGGSYKTFSRNTNIKNLFYTREFIGLPDTTSGNKKTGQKQIDVGFRCVFGEERFIQVLCDSLEAEIKKKNANGKEIVLIGMPDGTTDDQFDRIIKSLNNKWINIKLKKKDSSMIENMLKNIASWNIIFIALGVLFLQCFVIYLLSLAVDNKLSGILDNKKKFIESILILSSGSIIFGVFTKMHYPDIKNISVILHAMLLVEVLVFVIFAFVEYWCKDKSDTKDLELLTSDMKIEIHKSIDKLLIEVIAEVASKIKAIEIASTTQAQDTETLPESIDKLNTTIGNLDDTINKIFKTEK